MIRIDGSTYRRSHGAVPRGRGTWAFATVDPDRVLGNGNYLDHVIWVTGTFTDAKRAARLLVRNPETILRNAASSPGISYGWNPTVAYPGTACRARVADGAADDLSAGVDMLWVCP